MTDWKIRHADDAGDEVFRNATIAVEHGGVLHVVYGVNESGFGKRRELFLAPGAWIYAEDDR
jgi:hypothetical protein